MSSGEASGEYIRSQLFFGDAIERIGQLIREA